VARQTGTIDHFVGGVKDSFMRTRKPSKPKPAARITQKGTPRQIQLSQEAQLRLGQQEAALLKMKVRGASETQIAASLGVDRSTVNRIWASAMTEWNGDHHRLVSKKFAEMLAAHEAEIADTYTWEESDPAAAALIRHRARMAISRICGHGNVSKVEHTGANGGPIMTAQATPQDAAALVRARFNGIDPYTPEESDGDGGSTH
jgi:DNA-binding CsgD family transcriptional regulator